jgi:bifunctional DNA-binding transcriptional regulator/antitoxin component of YhaV-PrlF toxin-antitoxin module
MRASPARRPVRKLTPGERLEVFLSGEGDTFFLSRREAEEFRAELQKAADRVRSAERYRKVLQNLLGSVNKALGASGD